MSRMAFASEDCSAGGTSTSFGPNHTFYQQPSPAGGPDLPRAPQPVVLACSSPHLATHPGFCGSRRRSLGPALPSHTRNPRPHSALAPSRLQCSASGRGPADGRCCILQRQSNAARKEGGERGGEEGKVTQSHRGTACPRMGTLRWTDLCAPTQSDGPWAPRRSRSCHPSG